MTPTGQDAAASLKSQMLADGRDAGAWLVNATRRDANAHPQRVRVARAARAAAELAGAVVEPGDDMATPLTDADLVAVRAVVIAEPLPDGWAIRESGLVAVCSNCVVEGTVPPPPDDRRTDTICDAHLAELRARYNLTLRGA